MVSARAIASGQTTRTVTAGRSGLALALCLRRAGALLKGTPLCCRSREQVAMLSLV